MSLHRAPGRRALYAAGLASCALAADSADAYCLYAGSYDDFYRWAFPHADDPSLVGPIDVHLSDGALSSITHTGLTLEEFRPILLASLSELNTHLTITSLRYAGEHDHDPVDPQGALDFSPLPVGITVGSFGCDGAYAPCAPHQGPGLAGCAKSPPVMPMGGPPQHGKYLVSLVPSPCDSLASPSWSLSGVDGRDPLHVLLHELGHAMGLDHSDLAGAECPGVEDGDDQPNPSVMWSKVPAFATGRRLFRDDIEALETFWRTSDPSSLWYWNDAATFPASPDACALAPLGGTSGVPVSVSSAVDGFASDAAFLASTDVGDRVRVLEGGAAGFPEIAAAVEVDPFLRSGATLYPMGMALGPFGLDPVPLVVWLAGESTTSRDLDLRWAVRSAAGNWQASSAVMPEGVDGLDRRVAAGFDPTSGYFLVAAVTERAAILVMTVDIGGIQVAVTQLDDLLAYDVGPPACIVATGACVVPIMTSAPGGPGHAWLQVAIAGDGSATSLGIQDVNTSGMEGTSGGTGLAVWSSGAAVGTGVRGVLGERRIASPEWPPNGLAWDMDWYPNDDWPLRLGSVFPPDGDWAFPAVTRRLGPPYECGNGQLECDEECDDGNQRDGDGCTLCFVDGDPTGGSAAGGDTGDDVITEGNHGGEDTSGEACHCRTQSTPGAAFLLVLGLLGMRLGRSRGLWTRPAPLTNHATGWSTTTPR
jgi:cysteine-rich repeat protein